MRAENGHANPMLREFDSTAARLAIMNKKARIARFYRRGLLSKALLAHTPLSEWRRPFTNFLL